VSGASGPVPGSTTGGGGPPPLVPPPAPPPDIHSRPLTIRNAKPSRFIRIADPQYPPLNFRATASSRFDAPDKSFETLYVAESLEVCFSERFLRGDEKTNPLQGGFTFVPEAELDQAAVVSLHGKLLRLAVLAGIPLKTLGGEAGVSSISPYRVPQQWSFALYHHPEMVDGLVYMSRHINTLEAVVLFDRAKPKLSARVLNPLLEDRRIAHVLNVLQIAI
jgi:hypothetical protein